jgi:hypothetical protein
MKKSDKLELVSGYPLSIDGALPQLPHRYLPSIAKTCTAAKVKKSRRSASVQTPYPII